MNIRLDHIESRLQAFVEGSLNLLPGGRQHLLAHRLLAAIQQSVLENPEGGFSAPNTYTIFLNPDTLASLEVSQGWLGSLAAALQEAGAQDDLRFHTTPVIRLASDVHVAAEDLHVVAMHSELAGETAAMLVNEPPAPSDPRPLNAFLIINGHQIFPLRLAVVNMGRRLDNQVVLDDPRVSRAHAQLRAVRGRYLLFDLNSTGGTFVNGQRITQYTLKPGDVISLAGVAIIYGEDDPADTGNDSTADMPSPLANGS
ncbi:MAG TPA: FhaA domain-containing protein [Anaerolineaceae bacterium]|nr:FhaA domain-containing protein [Anaerolineaceae bacterium]